MAGAARVYYHALAVIAGLDAPTLAYAAAAVFVGALVRGYTGFGSSMVWVSSLALVLPPAEVVPVILMLEVLASLHLLPKAWSAVQWSTVWPIMAAAWAATPAGIWLLTRVPATLMQAAISGVVLATSVLLWRGYALSRTPGMAATVTTGIVSGVLTGSTSAGGPPVVLFYLSTPAAVGVQRASLIAYFLGSDAVGAGAAALAGLVTADSFLRVGLLLPAMILGTALGNRRFLHTTPEAFRRAALALLLALGIAGLVRALV